MEILCRPLGKTLESKNNPDIHKQHQNMYEIFYQHLKWNTLEHCRM